MAFQLTADGKIDSHPLAEWEVGIVAQEGLILRLQLARLGETQPTASICVQLTMSQEQMRYLIDGLKKGLSEIPPRPLAN